MKKFIDYTKFCEDLVNYNETAPSLGLSKLGSAIAKVGDTIGRANEVAGKINDILHDPFKALPVAWNYLKTKLTGNMKFTYNGMTNVGKTITSIDNEKHKEIASEIYEFLSRNINPKFVKDLEHELLENSIYLEYKGEYYAYFKFSKELMLEIIRKQRTVVFNGWNKLFTNLNGYEPKGDIETIKAQSGTN